MRRLGKTNCSKSDDSRAWVAGDSSFEARWIGCRDGFQQKVTSVALPIPIDIHKNLSLKFPPKLTGNAGIRCVIFGAYNHILISSYGFAARIVDQADQPIDVAGKAIADHKSTEVREGQGEQDPKYGDRHHQFNQSESARPVSTSWGKFQHALSLGNS